MSELSRLSEDVTTYERAARRAGDARVLWELASAEDDDATGKEAISELEALEAELSKLEVTALLGGEFDDNPAILEVHAGEGGTDSQDWAEILLRLYQRWAERRGFKIELVEVTPGDEAGIKSATLTVAGRHAYGLLAAERGVHRLVRISPLDRKSTRLNSSHSQ